VRNRSPPPSDATLASGLMIYSRPNFETQFSKRFFEAFLSSQSYEIGTYRIDPYRIDFRRSFQRCRPFISATLDCGTTHGSAIFDCVVLTIVCMCLITRIQSLQTYTHSWRPVDRARFARGLISHAPASRAYRV
jgi:hypothetical protein